MVKKALLILLAFGLASSYLWAAPVTVEQATQKAKRFMAAKKGNMDLEMVEQRATESRSLMGVNQPLLHIFNVGQDKGFIIISGEDSTPEVLAYTEQGSYDYDKLPPNAKVWIDNYMQQIEALRQNNVVTSDGDVEIHRTISPLLTCQWNQDAPYNSSCPQFFTNGQAVTGCVATAMAQVLYYHRFQSVTALQATIPAYQCSTNWKNYGRISVSSYAAGSPIDWANMIDKYDQFGITATISQKKAVADLMAYCGASVEMDYRDALNGGSGSSQTGIPEAFKKYFGYSEAATVKYRDHFTADNWDRLIYYELMNGRPVIFSGQDIGGGGGHAFVCDGYDGNGKYHFNWGWGGLADGYYTITNLQPTGQGIGGYSDAYNDKVSVVVGMEPGSGAPYEEKVRVTVTDFSKPTTQTVKSSATTYFDYEYSYQNHTTSTHKFDIALALYHDGMFKELLTDITADIEIPKTRTYTRKGTAIYRASTYDIGTYQVKVVSRLNGTEKWEESADADKWYVEMIVESDQITFVLHQYEEPEIVLGPDAEPEPRPEGVIIDTEKFPDTNFRKYLLAQEYGKDEVLTEEEIKSITSIDVHGQSISSLKGIELFTALTNLNCANNQLTTLDVSKNTALVSIDCSRNQIKGTSMDALISCLPQKSGSSLRVHDNRNSDEGNVCTKEQVTAAKVKGWTAEWYNSGWKEYEGYVEKPSGIDIDVTNFSDANFRKYLLAQEYGKDEVLTEEEIKNITSIDVHGQSISSLKGIELFTALTNLNCANNQLTMLDVSKNTALVSIDCSRNQIKGTSMDALISCLPQKSGGSLRVHDNRNSDEGNVCTKEQVTAAKAKGWTAEWYNSGWKEYEGYVEKPSGIDIDMTNFPDANFRKYLLAQEYGKDEVLTEEEIKNITSIDVHGQSISSLKGIELFTALTNLNCANNRLTTLDVSKNTALVSIDCSHNQIKGASMDAFVSSLPQTNKGKLYVYTTDGTRPPTPTPDEDEETSSWTEWVKNGKCEDSNADCFVSRDGDGDYQNRIVEGIGYNGSRGIRVHAIANPDNPWSTQFFVYTPDHIWKEGETYRFSTKVRADKPTYISVQAHGTPGYYIHYSMLNGTYNVGTEWTEITYEGTVTTAQAGAEWGGLQTIAFNLNEEAKENYFYFDDISWASGSDTTEDSSQRSADGKFGISKTANFYQEGNLPSIPTTHSYIQTSDSETDEGNICTIAQVAAAKAKGWTAYYYNAGNWQEYEGYYELAINATNFPDANFRSYLLGQSYGKDGVLTEEEIMGITSIDVWNKNITSLEGIEHFTALQELNCYSNRLTALDVSKNTALRFLYCYNNQLTTLNVSGCTNLEGLNCSDNLLTTLDVSNNTKLEVLECYSNRLAALDVSKNTALAIVFCYHNQLTGSSMEALTGSLPQTVNGDLYVYNDVEFEEGNICTKKHITAAKARGWTLYWYNGSQWVSYKGNEPGLAIDIDEANFPDANFRSYLLAQDYGKDNVLTEAEIMGVTSIDVNGQEISSLKGIEHFTALSKLNCSGNQLTALDVSKNTKLTELRCNNNRLTAIDLSNNTALESLYCFGNQLTALNVSKNAKITQVNCSRNQIYDAQMDALIGSLPQTSKGSLYVYNSNETDEGNVCTKKQVAAAKAKGWTVYYTANGLTWLGYEGSANAAEEPVSITLPAMETVNVNKTIQLTPTIEPADAVTELTWASDDETIAKVTSSGMVAGIKAGTAIITVRTSNGLKAECFVIVEDPTGIEDVKADGRTNVPIYTVSGQKVTGSLKGKKGVYIIGGKKVVVK